MEAFAERQRNPSNHINMVDVVQFALWSARRRDEICRLRWEDFHRESRSCAVRDVWKKGRKVTFPLIGPALDIVVRRQKEPEDADLIFPYNSQSVGAAFTLVKKDLGLEFTFGELREEGLRRLVEARQYPIALVQKLEPKKVLEIQAQIEEGGGI
jgi:integrase